MIFTVILHK